MSRYLQAGLTKIVI